MSLDLHLGGLGITLLAIGDRIENLTGRIKWHFGGSTAGQKSGERCDDGLFHV